MELTVIAHIETDFSSKFGVPRQSLIVPELEGRIVFEPSFRNKESLRGLEGFDYLWLLWDFSQAHKEGWSPTVRPPRLGGNRRVGVWATRSPFRPNNIGLSCVRLLGVDQDSVDAPAIRVGGVDMVSGTPIYDIKPYLPYTDAHPDASAGFTTDLEQNPVGAGFDARPQIVGYENEVLEVEMDTSLSRLLPPQKVEALRNVLAADPRPRYHNDNERIYGLPFAGVGVKFRVQGNRLTAWAET